MKKRKLKKKAKKLAKTLVEGLRIRISSFKDTAESYRALNADNPPPRCPCGKKWENCNLRDELLGVKGSA